MVDKKRSNLKKHDKNKILSAMGEVKNAIDEKSPLTVKNNIDKVFLQIRSRGDALYQSDLVPKYENLSIDFDPLNYFLEKNIHENVEIHAWLNTYILWSGKSLPSDSLHFYYMFPYFL